MSILTPYPWLALLAWTILYVADYSLTIHSARLYAHQLKEYIGLEGSFEITPYYQKDVNQLRTFSPRFLLMLVLSWALLGLLWFLSVALMDWPFFFELAIGGLTLREAAIHMRHLRNLALASALRAGPGLHGHLEHRRWLTLRLSALELLSFAGLYFLIGLAVGSFFLLGGALACLVTGGQHWRLYRKALQAASASGAADSVTEAPKES